LRTAEFYGKKGILLMPKVEAVEESEKMMNVYADFAQNFMAIPVVKGIKTETERLRCRGNILYRSINAGRKSITKQRPII
jgi:hypothetical protein